MLLHLELDVALSTFIEARVDQPEVADIIDDDRVLVFRVVDQILIQKIYLRNILVVDAQLENADLVEGGLLTSLDDFGDRDVQHARDVIGLMVLGIIDLILVVVPILLCF